MTKVYKRYNKESKSRNHKNFLLNSRMPELREQLGTLKFESNINAEKNFEKVVTLKFDQFVNLNIS